MSSATARHFRPHRAAAVVPRPPPLLCLGLVRLPAGARIADICAQPELVGIAAADQLGVVHQRSDADRDGTGRRGHRAARRVRAALLAGDAGGASSSACR